MNFPIIMLPGNIDLIYYVAGCPKGKISILSQEYFFRSLQEREESNRILGFPEVKALSPNLGCTIHSIFKRNTLRAT